MPLLQKLNVTISDELGGAVVAQLVRLNNNLERYLAYVGAPATDPGPVMSNLTYVGEGLTEFEMAVREHARGLGYDVDGDVQGV